MKNKRIIIMVLGSLMALSLAGTAGATTYNLKNDWNVTNNPNGQWSFWQGAQLLPHVNNWGNLTGQDAFAFATTGQGHVPVWLQAEATNFPLFTTGDILFHPTSVDLLGSSYPYGESFVKWTSPGNGMITISGNVFTPAYNWGTDTRGVDWTLSLGASQLDQGTVDYTSKFLNTINVASSYAVSTGDVVIFQGVRESGMNNAWFVGVNLNIEFNAATTSAVPEPCTLWLLGGGLLGLAGFSIKKKA